MAYAMPLNSSARSCVPADLLQLISVDYRAIKDSPTAMALKQQLMPDNIKQFEAALKAIGLDPDKDVDTLTFASFHAGKQGVKTVGVAAGPFNMKAVLKKMKLQKFVPKKYGTSDIYPMDGGFVMSFLDDSTLLFGDPTSIRVALDTRDGSGSEPGHQRHHGRHDVAASTPRRCGAFSTSRARRTACTPPWAMPRKSPITTP